MIREESSSTTRMHESQMHPTSKMKYDARKATHNFSAVTNPIYLSPKLAVDYSSFSIRATERVQRGLCVASIISRVPVLLQLLWGVV